MRMDIEVSGGLWCEIIANCGEVGQASGTEMRSPTVLEREQLKQEIKKDPGLTPGLL